MKQAVIIVLLLLLFSLSGMGICGRSKKVVKFNFINDTMSTVPFELIRAGHRKPLKKHMMKPNTTYIVYVVKGVRYSIKASGVKHDIGFAAKGMMDIYASDIKKIGTAFMKLNL